MLSVLRRARIATHYATFKAELKKRLGEIFKASSKTSFEGFLKGSFSGLPSGFYNMSCRVKGCLGIRAWVKSFGFRAWGLQGLGSYTVCLIMGGGMLDEVCVNRTKKGYNYL